MTVTRYVFLIVLVICCQVSSNAQKAESTIPLEKKRATGMKLDALFVSQPYSAGAGLTLAKEIGKLEASISISYQFVPFHSSSFCYTYNPTNSSPARLENNAGPRQPIVGFEGTVSIQTSYTLELGLRKHLGVSGWHFAIAPEYHLLNWKAKFERSPVEESNEFFGNCGAEFSVSIVPWEGGLESIDRTVMNAAVVGRQHFIGLSIGTGYDVTSGIRVFDRLSFELNALYLHAIRSHGFAPRPVFHEGRDIVGALIPKDVRYGVQFRLGYRLVGRSIN